MTAHPNGTNGTSEAPTSVVPEDWWIFQGTGRPLDPQQRDQRWPLPPPWRDFTERDGADDEDLQPAPDLDDETRRVLGRFEASQVVDVDEVRRVNAAIYLRRPLLVTGKPGTGKSSLAHRISRELGLGRVLRWPITSRTLLRAGQYEYDAIGRARAIRAAQSEPSPPVPGKGKGHRPDPPPDSGMEEIGKFIQLGPLGTALLPQRLPRVLLIDEMDKSDLDLPNDLLTIFEEGQFVIPELLRIREMQPQVEVFTSDPGVKATITGGVVKCHSFPIIVITSNDEREFPPAFRRRCLILELKPPTREKLLAMVSAHFPADVSEYSEPLVARFLKRSERVGGLAADQFLNAVALATSHGVDLTDHDQVETLLESVWHPLTPADR